MKLLVTGGAGFIGSYFVKYMLGTYKDIEIVNLDALTYAGDLETLNTVATDARYLFVKGDVADTTLIDGLFAQHKFDKVVHFAAESHVDRSVSEPDIFIRTNIVGTHVLLEAARKYGIQQFHQVSTDEVYGDLPLNQKDLFFTEETPIRPSSPYSASKASADMLVLAYGRTYGIPVTISRCSNNYGPYQFPEKLIPVVISKVMEQQPIPVYGNGKNIRDWLYVEDHCRGIDVILQKGKMGEVYNIGGHNELENLTIVQCILKQLGASEEQIIFVEDRKGHDLRYAIDAIKMKETLGWEPSYTFEEGIAQTIAWYVQHKSWWEGKIVKN
ncbi:MAG: dTDP-glucose 4,6-dehydratase [Cellulosilyticaceae bacterium]